MSRKTLAAVGALVSLSALSSAFATALPVLLDGYYDEWTAPALHTDPAGDDGSSGIDFRNLYVAEDDDWLFVRFDTTVEIPLQEDTNIALYLDTDADPGTGVGVNGLGAELRWRFGFRSGTFYNLPPVNIDWPEISMRIAPNVTGTDFEVAIRRDARPDGSTFLFQGDHIRVLLRDEDGTGDHMPDNGEFADYFFTNEGLPPVAPNDLAKQGPNHLRLVTMNVLFDSPWDPGQDERYARILQAIDPDIICFQEIFGHSFTQTRAKVETWLGGSWFAFGVDDAHTISRYPFTGIWQIGNNLAMLLDTSDEIARDLLVINTHLPCCDNDAGRQGEADQIMAFVRDAKEPGVGPVDLDPGTGILLTGDMNLVGSAQQLRTLRDGDILDEATHGPDFDPDWDGTSLLDLASPQTEVRMPYTWRNELSSNTPGRIDMWLMTSSVLGVGNHFTLFTPNMSPAQLALHGLLEDDSTEASDHIPHVTDVYDATVSVANAVPLLPGGLRVSPNPVSLGSSFTISLPAHRSVRVEIFDVAGRRVRTLAVDAGFQAEGTYPFVWGGRSDTGATATSGAYFVRVTGIGEEGVPFRYEAPITILR